jgi:hypothetical protein
MRQPMQPDPMRGRCQFRVHVLLAFALAAWATGAAVQAGPVLRLEEGRFFLEKITVEGVTSFAPEIVVAESLLKAGRTYSESELRDAVHRIKRLPLVLGVEFSLKKGSERDRYELVIRIRETRRWFWGLDLNLAGWSEPVSVSGVETTSFTESDLFLIGRRFAAGRHGIAYAALGGADGTIQLGYSNYNLFGRGGFGSLSLGWADCASNDGEPPDPSDVGKEGCQTELVGLGLDPTYSNWSATGDTVRLRLTLGYPLGGNQSLRLKGSYRATDFGLRRLALDTDPDRLALVSDRHDVALNLSWVSNSVDDPVFPTRGTLLEAGLDVQTLEADLVQYDLAGTPTAREAASSSRQLAALATVTRHWPVGERGAFSLGGEALIGRSRIRGLPGYDLELLDADVTVWSASATAGYGLFLKQLHTGERWRELRWESSAQLLAGGIAPSLGQDQVPHYGARVTTGLTYRNTWGVLRFTFSWIGLEATP